MKKIVDSPTIYPMSLAERASPDDLYTRNEVDHTGIP
jgi:hypothetical protein